MTKRTTVRIGAALAIVLVAVLSTMRAGQVWSENQARGTYAHAEAQTLALISRAKAEGLLSSELAPYLHTEHKLSSARPPSSLPFWSSGADKFYTRQASAFNLLTRRIHALVRQVTSDSYLAATGQLQALDKQIQVGKTYALDTSQAQTVYRAEAQNLHSASTPRAFRAISGRVTAASSTLGKSVADRQAYVQSVLQTTQGARSGVMSRAAGEVAQADQQLTLLSLLTSRASAYRDALGQLSAKVNSAGTPFAAAVALWSLEQETKLVSADYSRTLPAKMVVVSTENQSAQMYESGRQVYSTPVTTGGPELPTDHGVFHIYMKVSPFVFHSPWPPSSPFYYPPTPINYWMPFDGGQGLHDASWRSNFGPGSNDSPTDLGTGRTILGTHGCVNLPMDAATYVWNWAPVGTTVVVI